MMGMRTALWSGIAGLVLAGLGQAAPQSGSRQEAAAQSEFRREVRELIEDLGSPEFEVRHEAARKLESLGPRVRRLLEKAREETDDPEVRWRLGRILRRLGTAQSRSGRPRLNRERLEAAPRRARPDEDELEDELEGRMRELEKRLERMRRRMEEEMKRFFRQGAGGMGPLPWKGFGGGRLPSIKGGKALAKGLSVRIGPNGVRVEIEEKDEHGKTKRRVYEAPDVRTLLKEHPELRGKIFGRLGAEGFGFGGPGFQFRFFGPGQGWWFGPGNPFDFWKDLPGFGGMNWDLEHGERRRHEGHEREGARDEEDTGRGRRGAERRAERAEEGEEDEGPRLGIYIAPDIPSALRDYLDLERGVGLWIRGTVDGSLAERLGLEKGDILVELNGQEVGSPADVRRVLRRTRKGDVVRAVFLRKGRRLDAKARR